MIAEKLMGMENAEQRAILARFFKTGKGQYGEGDLFLGIKVPQVRSVVREHWKQCSEAEMEQLVCSPYHELRLCGLLILVQKFSHARKDEDLRRSYVDFYLSHTDHINNWDLVDLSCYEIVGTWLLDRDRSLLYELARNGRTMWEQRIAMVSCMQLVRHGEYEDCLAIADILLHHTHDLIHKAVGWMLREVDKREPELLRAYLKPRYSTMPRTMLRYAIEHFPEEERQRYLKGMV